jgi:hypothetical protein
MRAVRSAASGIAFDMIAGRNDADGFAAPRSRVSAAIAPIARQRTVRMNGALSQDTARLNVFKLVMAASGNWRDCTVKTSCVNGIKFKDGIETVAELKSAGSRRHRLSRIAPTSGSVDTVRAKEAEDMTAHRISASRKIILDQRVSSRHDWGKRHRDIEPSLLLARIWFAKYR